MFACSVVRFCAVVNKLHFYFYIIVMRISYDESHLSVGVLHYMCHIKSQPCACILFDNFINMVHILKANIKHCFQQKV